jgi:hypothetical protein
MDSKGTGLTLSIGVVAAFIGYILWQLSIGFNTKVDDIPTILTNSANSAGLMESIQIVLIGVGLTVHVAGLRSLEGTAKSTCETLGTFCVTVGMVIFIVSLSGGIALTAMGGKFVAASAGAAAGDAASIAAIPAFIVAGGFAQSASVGAGIVGGLLVFLGWLFIGLAYRNVDFKGAISFIPVGWLAIATGIIGLVAILIINPVVSVEAGNQVTGISFLLITIWSVSVGLKLAKK